MAETPATPAAGAPQVSAVLAGAELRVELGGTWRLRGARPDPERVVRAAAGTARWDRMMISARDLAAWDSSLLLFVAGLRALAAAQDATCRLQNLPAAFAGWLQEIAPEPPPEAPVPYAFPITRSVGVWTSRAVRGSHAMLEFFGECVLGLARLVRHPGGFRWSDGFAQMRRCGAQALGIVSLITFLVGVIIAYVGAAQFRQIGADVFVADLVGLAVFRELGPMMTAIVLAGRTGAAFAAELGNMRLNEEIDALETLGVRPHDFLVTPRLLGLGLMTPLLALYADFLGVAGGVLVARVALDLSPQAFLVEMQGAVHLNDILTGLFKSAWFGFLIGYSGCLRGLHAARSATGVGEAATFAVVQSILLIIVADAVFTVLFNILQW